MGSAGELWCVTVSQKVGKAMQESPKTISSKGWIFGEGIGASLDDLELNMGLLEPNLNYLELGRKSSISEF